MLVVETCRRSHQLATEAFHKVVCVDISDRALGLTRKKLGNKGEYHNGSVLSLSLTNDTFDAVLCAHMLYHVDKNDQVGAVRELIRVTKAEGRIVVIYCNPRSPLMLIQQALKVLHVNKLLRKDKLYVHVHPIAWRDQFRDSCNIEVLPNDSISANQAKVLLPFSFMRRCFYRLCHGIQNRNPWLAARLWSYVAVVLDKKPKAA
ncbi:MAG: methyltransferase domain-containing protein [Alphaproteobacteria bacterium]|nr:methyltransferase domain-containing protein [Alphaproteobacteria bacterium]